MFDPIKGPSNEYGAPAVGHGTENGDSWHTAVKKINAGFKNIVKAIEGGAGAGAPDDEALGKRLTEIEDALAALQIKVDALTAPKELSALELGAAISAAVPPRQPPAPSPSQEPIADFPASPGAAGGSGVVTTASTYIGAGNPASGNTAT